MDYKNKFFHFNALKTQFFSSWWTGGLKISSGCGGLRPLFLSPQHICLYFLSCWKSPRVALRLAHPGLDPFPQEVCVGGLDSGVQAEGSIPDGRMKIILALVSAAKLWGDEWCTQMMSITLETWKGIFTYWW